MSRFTRAAKMTAICVIAYGLFVEAFISNYGLLMTHVLVPMGDQVMRLAGNPDKNPWPILGIAGAMSVVLAAFILLSGWVFLIVTRTLRFYAQKQYPDLP